MAPLIASVQQTRHVSSFNQPYA